MNLRRPTKSLQMGRVTKRAAALSALLLASWVGLSPVLAGGSSPIAQPTKAARASAGCCLRPGDSLRRGDSMSSPDGRFVMWLQADGNLVEYAIGGNTLVPRWVRGNKSGSVLWMQFDGNAVLYRQDGKPVWWSNTSGHPQDRLYLQSDANLVIYTNSNSPVFANRAQAPPYLLRNVNSQKCAFSGLAPHDPITQTTCSNSSGNETNEFLPLGGNQYRISNFGPHDACFDVANDAATPIQLQVLQCMDAVGQSFRWSAAGPPGRGTLRTETSQTSPFNCVGVAGGSTADGAAVDQAPCNGGSSQLWDLMPWEPPLA